MRNTRFGLVFLLAILLVGREVKGAGVTTITHGAQVANSYPGWLDEMATAIANRAGPSTAIIKAELGASGVKSFTLESGVLPSDPNSQNAEIVIKLFWHTIAGLTDPYTGTDVANDIYPYLTSSLTWQGGIATRPFVELPIHLIGHSRGAGVVSAGTSRN